MSEKQIPIFMERADTASKISSINLREVGAIAEDVARLLASSLFEFSVGINHENEIFEILIVPKAEK